MKNYYYIEYTNNFGNTYNLYYARYDVKVPETLARINRDEAIQKCRDARIDETGFASTYILPFSAYGKSVQLREPVSGYIVAPCQLEVIE